MSTSRWWQLAIGVLLGTMVAIYLPFLGFMVAIVLGLVLAWASLTNDGDDAMTAGAAGYLTGILGFGVFRVTDLVFHTPFWGSS